MPILFYTGDDLDLLVDKINVEMTNVYAWVKASKLSLNVDKTILGFLPQNAGHGL